MRSEPPIDQPAHRFEDVDVVEAECVDCDTLFDAEPESLESDGVYVQCPTCGGLVFVRLD